MALDAMSAFSGMLKHKTYVFVSGSMQTTVPSTSGGALFAWSSTVYGSKVRSVPVSVNDTANEMSPPHSIAVRKVSEIVAVNCVVSDEFCTKEMGAVIPFAVMIAVAASVYVQLPVSVYLRGFRKVSVTVQSEPDGMQVTPLLSSG